MKSNKVFFLGLALFFLALVPMSATGQSTTGDRIIYPPEFSPLIASRPRPEEPSLIPDRKFVKVQNAIPNRYIVVLNDDVVASDAPLDVRRAQITEIADSLAQAHLGTVGFIYETALKGFSVELPDESAAIALSENSQVKWVSEDGLGQVAGPTLCGETHTERGEISTFNCGKVRVLRRPHTSAGLDTSGKTTPAIRP